MPEPKIELQALPRQKNANISSAVAEEIFNAVKSQVNLGDSSKIRSLGLIAQPDGNFRLIITTTE